ncbi:hypothetical protein HOY82DRAFT_638504 [Tuber indicum]|nr:hypothetical protein HOY82DRAFT_638504 [Tuber indicum]
MNSTPGTSSAASAPGFSRSGQDHNAGIGRRPSRRARASRNPPGRTTNGTRMGTETPEQVRASLDLWEPSQELDRDYFDAKEKMEKRIEAITAPLSLDPRANDFVQPANGHPTPNFQGEVGGEPMTLDALRPVNRDYGYSMRNFITDDSNIPAGGAPVGEIYSYPEYAHRIPSTSGLRTGATWGRSEKDGRVGRGYGSCGWGEEVVGTPSRQ